MLHELLGISLKEKRVVSLLGGGGKTTLMYALARESVACGKTALFTTTNIFVPEEEDIVFLEPFSQQKAMAVWEEKKIVTAGQPLAGGNKLTAPDESVQQWLFAQANGIYIEADGSKRLPLKYPAAWEPVIPDTTTHRIVVAGLSALGQPRQSVVHRAELAEKECGYREPAVTEAGMADLLWSGYGCYDPIFLLNQADSGEMDIRGQRVAERLISHGAKRVIVLSLKNHLTAEMDMLSNV